MNKKGEWSKLIGVAILTLAMMVLLLKLFGVDVMKYILNWFKTIGRVI